MHVFGAHRGQKREPDDLEPELQMVASHWVDLHLGPLQEESSQGSQPAQCQNVIPTTLLWVPCFHLLHALLLSEWQDQQRGLTTS